MVIIMMMIVMMIIIIVNMILRTGSWWTIRRWESPWWSRAPLSPLLSERSSALPSKFYHNNNHHHHHHCHYNSRSILKVIRRLFLKYNTRCVQSKTISPTMTTTRFCDTHCIYICIICIWHILRSHLITHSGEKSKVVRTACGTFCHSRIRITQNAHNKILKRYWKLGSAQWAPKQWG